MRVIPSLLPHRAEPLFSGSVLNVAHRGASDSAPENTLAAVWTAAAHGADLVEVDVHRSRDGALVVVHDTLLTRTTDVRTVFPSRSGWQVGQLTLAQLRRLDAGSWKSRTYCGERVPTLNEVLDLTRRLGLGLLVEVKSPELYPGIEHDLLAVLREDLPRFEAMSLAGRFAVQSFDHGWVRRLKGGEPRLSVGLLGSPDRSALPRVAEWANLVNPSHRLLDRRYVDEVHEAGLRCVPWTVNRTSKLRRVLDLGVDGIITNRPSRLHQLLAPPLGRVAA